MPYTEGKDLSLFAAVGAVKFYEKPFNYMTVHDDNARVSIWTKETIDAVIEIVRSVKRGDMYEYGGVFVGMPEADAVKIEIYQLFEEYGQ